jgi:hypothetical protein
MELSLSDLKDLIGGKSDDHPWVVGKIYHIRTVTMALAGKLIKVSAQELLLEDASWIADSGRYSDYLNDTEKANEVEPIPGRLIVGRGSIVDACEVKSQPRKQK